MNSKTSLCETKRRVKENTYKLFINGTPMVPLIYTIEHQDR